MLFNKELTIKDLLDFCPELISEVQGPTHTALKHFCSLENPEDQCFVFINHPKYFLETQNNKIVAVLAPLSLKEKLQTHPKEQTWIFSKNVDWVAQKIKNQFVFKTPYRPDLSGVHSTAMIDSSAKIAAGVVIAPYAVIGKNCEIGEGSFIGSHCVVEENAVIHKNVTLHPFVYIGHSCVIGNECEIKSHAIIGSEGFGYAHDHIGQHYRIPHTGRVILQDRVHVGAGTAIDRGTLTDSVIGSGTKIDNQCHLAHNTVVGKNGLLTAQLVTAGSSKIGDHFVCGGKTAITGHIEITDHVNVAGLSGISNDVLKPGQYGGYPLQPLRDFLKVKATSVHLPELRKQMNRVLRKLFPEDFQNDN